MARNVWLLAKGVKRRRRSCPKVARLRHAEKSLQIMNSIAIIGGGITGLVAAYRLREKGFPVTVYEASERVGGVIQTVRQDGYLAECGPNTILEGSPKIPELVTDLDLSQRRIYCDPEAKKRYVVRNKRLVNLPATALGFVTTPLLSPAAKLRALTEPFVRRVPETKEESVAEFVERRFGPEFLYQALDSLVSNIYPSDTEKLSVSQAFPKLRARERRNGSLIKGRVLRTVKGKKDAEVAKPDAPKFSFDHGLQVLTDTLYDKLRPVLRLNSPVIKITQKKFGWAVTTRIGDCELHQGHSAVLYAGTAFRLPEIQVATDRYINWSPFAEIHYPAVASVVLGFRREDLAHPLNGFGVLVPRTEGFNILGTIFSSSLFSNRAPAGCVTLTSYLDGGRTPDLAKRSGDELCKLVYEDLRVLLGIRGEPTFNHDTLFPKAIPQYDVGFGRFRTLMKQIESKAPRLFFAGNYRDGISLAESIVSAEEGCERIQSSLASAASTPAKSRVSGRTLAVSTQ